MREPGFAEFPDCVAARSARHLHELADMVAAGARAALVYVIQMDAERFDVARDIDPAYDKAFPARPGGGRRNLRLCVPDHREEVVIDRQIPIVTRRDQEPFRSGSATVIPGPRSGARNL